MVTGASSATGAEPLPFQVYTPPPAAEASTGAAAEAVPEALPDASAPQELPGEKSREELEKQVEKLNKTAKGLDHRLAFDVYEGTDEFYAKVIDRRTNKVLKLLPMEGILELHRKLQEAVGAIVDEKA